MMNTLAITKQQIYLVIGRHTTEQMLDLAAQVALRGALRVLDGCNSFNVNIVARNLRRLTSQVHPALERILVARAFTCYEMVTLISTAPTDGIPTFLTGLLSSFYDENVDPAESQRLLKVCIPILHKLSLCQPVVISSKPPNKSIVGRMVLLNMLSEVANQVVSIEEIVRVDSQMVLPF